MSKEIHQYLVVMAGGAGTRLWPFSRESYPKQFHDLLGVGKTLLQLTVGRFADICPPENIYVVTNMDYKALVKAQLPFLTDDQILLEPSKRNTAPCVAYAAFKIYQKDPQATMVVAPADQMILQEEKFTQTISKALKTASKKDYLITLGIQPHRPDTGYGYIQFHEEKKGNLHQVKLFTEKPEYELAVKFLESGDFLWNSGIFIWNAKAIRQALATYAQDLYESFDLIKNDFFTDREQNAINLLYATCKANSIDYAVMEKADNVFVIPCDFGWSDLGTWQSIYDISPKDNQGNVSQPPNV
ncbi:MAG TPA: mannose-1-phosphate guanylyltransferase, partial [Microscillaceae bacterium]|nr:mannose-1-phosphate guanylyltransferase [Microscillaceae bacterium]